MRAVTRVTAVAALVVSSLAADAPVVTNSPGSHYMATMPAGGSQAVVAEIAVETPTNRTGALFTININGRPQVGGPFMYHIHQYPVPANGSCIATGGHLDPYGRGESPACDSSQPQTCQVGDLSGKHRSIDALPGFSTQFIDKYISLTPGTPAFIGNRSLVIHYQNSTRLACANFKISMASGSNSTSTSSPSQGAAGGSASSSPTSSATRSPSVSAPANSSSAAMPRAVAPLIDKIFLGPLLAAIAFAVGLN